MTTTQIPIKIPKDYGSIQLKEDNESNCCSCCCECFCIFVWLVFGGGFIMLFFWYFIALTASILLIPLPYSIQLFNLTPALVTPNYIYTDAKTVNIGCCHKFSRFIWIFPFGLILAILHIIFGILYSPLLLCCIPWSKYHFKQLSNVFNPCNKIILNTKINKFNYYSTSDQIVQNVNNLSNKVCIITGCNSGIGKETAKQLYSKGCIIIMACRNLEKANKAKNDIINQVNNGSKNYLQIIRLDLADLKTIDEFVKQFYDNKIANGKLDYLINNAGVMAFPKFGTTKDGIERQFGINHLGHFYLVNKLLPILKKNKTRIINVSSCGHYLFNTSEDMTCFLNSSTLHPKGPTPNIIAYNKSGFRYYGISKLCNVLFTRSLNKFYNVYGIVSLCLHPGGIIETGLYQHMSINCNLILNLRYFLSFPAMHEGLKPKRIPSGAATTLRCVTISDEEIFNYNYNDIKNMKFYFDDCIARNDKIHKEFINGQNTEIDQALWDYSCKIISYFDYLQLNDCD